jgi:integrase
LGRSRKFKILSYFSLFDVPSISIAVQQSPNRCGIRKTIGWHTSRHSFATQLKANGEDVKIVQKFVRHANSRTTLDTYTQASSPAKRRAQTKVVRMILPERNQTAEAGGGK